MLYPAVVVSLFVACLILAFLSLSCPGLSCPVLLCLTLPNPFLSFPVLPCPALLHTTPCSFFSLVACAVLPCLALFCPSSPCHAPYYPLPGPILPPFIPPCHFTSPAPLPRPVNAAPSTHHSCTAHFLHNYFHSRRCPPRQYFDSQACCVTASCMLLVLVLLSETHLALGP